MLSPVHMSVCLSVTQVDQSKTVEVRIMQLSRQCSPIPLVLRHKLNPEILTGVLPERGRQTRVGWEKSYFLALCVDISKTVQDTTTKVTTND